MMGGTLLEACKRKDGNSLVYLGNELQQSQIVQGRIMDLLGPGVKMCRGHALLGQSLHMMSIHIAQQ